MQQHRKLAMPANTTKAATMTATIEQTIATELAVREAQVLAAVALLDGGATVPFVARYRKEVTGGLDDVQLRTLHERLGYLRELAERRAVVLESISSQGKLTDSLADQIAAAMSKSRLEDIYLPFKPKRRTKAQTAREAGLEPLADALIKNPTLDPGHTAAGFVAADLGVSDTAAALEGARAILIERFGEDPDLVGELRERYWSQGTMRSRVRAGQEEAGAKFSDYFAFDEPLTKLPSHRILALLRAESEAVVELDLDPEPSTAQPTKPGPSGYERAIAARFDVADRNRPADLWLGETVRLAWRSRVKPRLGIDLRVRLREKAETEAVRVFAANLKDLLLAAPAGARVTMGLDPGYRSGTKVAVIDTTGKVLATTTIYPHKPQDRWAEALATLRAMAEAHQVQLLAIGNGTASRETDKLAAELLKTAPQLGLIKATVSEAGASVYSASAYATEELPELDVTLRGAVSIARRLQDPLAELVKIDPKSIGVGQYQHDLSELKLSRSLDAVVEDCVNAVGVDVNTASAPLLARVSGITSLLAANIVAHRDANGRYTRRAALKQVPRLGERAFEQCAGFLRIPGGEDPLDASAVHPETYPVVREIAKRVGTNVPDLIGNNAALSTVRPADFVTDRFGLPTITDILAELHKPGRDPRPAFTTATFAEGVDKISDLRPGMVLEGTVTNVAAFGAFVDVGVHQDGLVHVSALSKTFVSNPRDIVKPGDVVKVKVLDVDLNRGRISLTLRLDDQISAPGSAAERAGSRRPGPRPDQAERPNRSRTDGPETALANALRRAGLKTS